VARVRLDRKATSISLLVVIGVREDGQKILLAIKNMGGETTEAWRAVLDDLIKRGLRRPQFLINLPKSPLLITESADEFDAVRDAFEREIKPQGIIEQMYVHDISSLVWEILRLRWSSSIRPSAAHWSIFSCSS
jgi:hypothetical protein